MKKRRLKKGVIYGIYALSFAVVLTSIFFIEKAMSNNDFKKDNDYQYVSKTIVDEEQPVVGQEVQIVRPYTDSDIKIVKNYYDYQAEKELQENSIIIHEDTYLQNSGISYSAKDAGKEKFDVVAILDGTVTSVKEDNLLGKIVEIRHTNDMISIYQSLSEINVKENDVVKQNSIIGKSGTSNISTSLGDHLHFELIYKGQIVNPEYYYDKRAGQLQ